MNQSAPVATTLPNEVGNLRLTLLAVLGSVGALLLLAAGIFLVHMRTVVLDAAAQRAADTARLLEEHIVRTLGVTDFVVGRVAALAASMPQDELARSEELHRQMRDLEKGLPERGSLWLMGADGTLLANSIEFPLKASVNIADRKSFQAHAAGVARMVGPLIRGRYDGKLAFTYTRRVEGPDGRFLGVASAGLEADYFTDFYKSFALGPKGNNTLINPTGDVILRQPDPGSFLSASVAGGPVLTAAAKAPSGVLRAASPLDGIERLMGYRVVADYGLVVTSGIAVDDALADWRRTAMGVAAVLALSLTALGALATLALRSLDRERQVLHTLEHLVELRTEEARDQAEQARRANDSKTRFLAAASHDLRQPLQAAGMFVEALAGRLEEPGHLGIIDKLRQSVEATNALLTTLLDVSALEAGRIQTNPSAFPIWSLLSRLAGQFEPEATARGLEIRVLPCTCNVVSDPVLLERLLRNLLVNALRYTDQGRIVLGCRQHGREVAIVVGDTGIGIPADKLQAIFDDFTRIETAGRTSKEGRGLGLGLGVVRRMAAMLGHTVTVKSKPGKGSVFSVTVPKAG